MAPQSPQMKAGCSLFYFYGIPLWWKKLYGYAGKTHSLSDHTKSSFRNDTFSHHTPFIKKPVLVYNPLTVYENWTEGLLKKPKSQRLLLRNKHSCYSDILFVRITILTLLPFFLNVLNNPHFVLNVFFSASYLSYKLVNQMSQRLLSHVECSKHLILLSLVSSGRGVTLQQAHS